MAVHASSEERNLADGRNDSEAAQPLVRKGARHPTQGSGESSQAAFEQELQEGAQKAGMSLEDYNAYVATGKVMTHLLGIQSNKLKLQSSIYDAAFVTPQICRSGGYPPALTWLAVRCYMFLFANFGLQLFILYMIATEEFVMDKYAGQMYLCNMGANIDRCPDGPNCVGPGGTNYQNAGRMYDYNSWATRTFVRDSLTALFPDKADFIQESIDPGEYGLESYWVRWVCIFIFMMSVMSDLRSTMDMAYIVWCIPSEAQPWLEYKVPRWAPRDHVKEVREWSELDFVRFKIAGMPRVWKIVNMVTIIAPKMFIWLWTAKYGVMFLMETAGIEDVIVNVTALTFILNLDEMIFDNFSHDALHYMVKNVEPWLMEDTEGAYAHHSAADAYDVAMNDKKGGWCRLSMIPIRPFVTLILTVIFVELYYWQLCGPGEQGGLVSVAVKLPKTPTYPLMNFFVPTLSQELEEEPYWQP